MPPLLAVLAGEGGFTCVQTLITAAPLKLTKYCHDGLDVPTYLRVPPAFRARTSNGIAASTTSVRFTVGFSPRPYIYTIPRLQHEMISLLLPMSSESSHTPLNRFLELDFSATKRLPTPIGTLLRTAHGRNLSTAALLVTDSVLLLWSNRALKVGPGACVR